MVGFLFGIIKVDYLTTKYMVLRVEGVGASPEDVDFSAPKERVDLAVERKEEFEFIIRSIQEVLHKEHKANEGNNGVIFKIRVKEHEGDQEVKEYAAKLLKVGDFKTLNNEYDNQRRAYEIIQEAIEAGANEADFAKVPHPDFCQEIGADEDMKSHLVREGVRVSGDDVGVMAMDWINGEDVATYLFKETLRRKNSPYLETIKQNDFNHLLGAVGMELGYAQPGGKATREGDKIFETTKVAQENEGKLYKFLKKDGYIFPKKTVEQISNTIDLLEKNGLAMWDSHARNVMIDSNGENPYLIDFAPQARTIGEDAKSLDARALIRTLKTLTTTIEEDDNAGEQIKLELFDKELNRMKSNERWFANYVAAFPDKDKFLNEARYQITAGITHVDDFIFAVLCKKEAGELTSDEVIEFFQTTKEKSTMPWVVEKLKTAIKKAS